VYANRNSLDLFRPVERRIVMGDKWWEIGKPKTAEAVEGMEKKKPREWEHPKPSDLKYVLVQKTGLARQVGSTLENRRKEMEKQIKEME
jgi:hypothetical protein